MRRKKLLRQVAAAAVALSMAVSLSAPAFATAFDLSNGGLVITANDSGITVKQDGQKETTIGKDDEIVITGTYSSANGATLTAEENQQDENQPVTPAKAPAKEKTQEAEDAPAAEEKQEQKDTEAPADPEQKTETENKDKNNDPDNEEKKEQNASAEGEEQPKPKAEAKAEAKASAEATASASDNASNGSRKAPARSSGEGERSSEGEHRGIIQIFANTLVKLKLKDATIDQPNAADTNTRGMAAIDIQGSGNVEIKVEGNNTLNGYGNSAGIQKNDDVSTGKLTITAEDKDQTLNVNADVRGAAIGGNGHGWYGSDTDGSGHGTKNIEIKGGTVNTQGRIGSGTGGGSAENIVITGDAVVNANGGIGGGFGGGPRPPPPVKKKYSKDHMLMLIFIYYFKSLLSFNDIEELFRPITSRHFTGKDSPLSLEDIYTEVFTLEKGEMGSLMKDVTGKFARSRKTFQDVSVDEEDKEYLQLFAFICELSFDVYLKTQMIEMIADQLRGEATPPRKK